MQSGNEFDVLLMYLFIYSQAAARDMQDLSSLSRD